MSKISYRIKKMKIMNHLSPYLFCISLCLILSSCGTPETVVGSAIGITAFGGRSPGHELQQVYYLGAFDPLEQLPPLMYRITVFGQASVLSSVKFSSGWVRSELIDSLNTQIEYEDGAGGMKISRIGDEELSGLNPSRRLYLFGPEGFREAPKDHRLVIVMGSSPQKFFEAVDQTLSIYARSEYEEQNTELIQKIFAIRNGLMNQQQRLNDIEAGI